MIPLEAAARIGSAITIPEIPEKYKKYKLINRGTTSIILEKSADTVLVLTRDDIKADWFKHSDIAKLIEQIDKVRASRFQDFPIYVFEMPKLSKIGKGNISKVNQVINDFSKLRGTYYNQPHYKLINALNESIDEHDLKFDKPHELADFIRFITNYDESQYKFDLRRANFMQDNDGNIVVVDPVISSELMEMFVKPHRMAASDETETTMTKPFNPLLDKRKKTKTELTASDLEASNGPISPLSGTPMVLAKCRTTPVWVDAKARLVLPVRRSNA